ncbi:MAG TPA: glycosyltransferase family 39 protein [Patescibacteria group bacterium]|nr:glycosyltransferase family 39 protein [Patescibacteria group bacterium]
MVQMLTKLFTDFKFLLIIVVIAAFLRFFQLGVNPPSLDWDEASLGYNAYSILQTGADEYGNKFPTAIRSFGDYKPAAYVYLDIPSVYLFGLNEFGVRFPSAFFGALTVLVVFFMVRELFGSNKLALLSSFLLAISPWHLQFSRTAFEANIGLFFFISAVFIFLKALKNPKFFILSFILFALTLYSYQSFRLVAPVFVLGLLIYFRKSLWKKRKIVLISAILALVVLVPFLKSLLTDLSRFSSVTVLTPTGTLDSSIKELQYDKSNNDRLGELLHNRRIVYSLTVIKGYLDHYDPNFLFVKGDGVPRHHPVDFGMLYLLELPFVLLGILNLYTKKGSSKFIVFWWFLIAPVASALTTGTPHPVRALAFLPTFQIFSALGILKFIEQTQRFKFKTAILAVTAVVFILNIAYYLHQYYVHTPRDVSESWQYGSKELFSYLSKVDKNYDKVVVTYKYDQPYIFYLFYNKIDPSWYQKHWDYKGDGTVDRMKRVIGKYEFRNIDYNKDRNIKKALIIGTPDEIPKEKAIKEIKFLDGSVAFRIASS